MRTVTKLNQVQFYVKTKKVCRCFANISSEQEHFTHGMYKTALIHASDVKEHFTHGMYITALIRASDVKKEEPIMFYE